MNNACKSCAPGKKRWACNFLSHLMLAKQPGSRERQSYLSKFPSQLQQNWKEEEGAATAMILLQLALRESCSTGTRGEEIAGEQRAGASQIIAPSNYFRLFQASPDAYTSTKEQAMAYDRGSHL